MTRRKTTQVEEFDPARVKPMPGQPRKRFFGIRELAASIQQVGQLSPGAVILLDQKDFDAQLIDGERRLRACKVAGVPFRAEICQKADAEELFARSFGANFGKQHHDVIEIAEGLARMRAADKTLEQCAAISGMSIGWVQHHLNLLKLHPQVQAMMVRQSEEDERPPLTLQLAQLLVPLDEQMQLKIARQVTSGGGMGIAEARRMILKKRHRMGDKSAYNPSDRHGSVSRARGAMTSAIETTVHKLGVWIDMPGASFNSIVDAMQPYERRNLVEKTEELIDSLEGIRDGIAERIEKAKARS